MSSKTVAAITRVENFLAVVSAVVILLMMLATTADVAGRYLFNSPIQGVYEASELVMALIVFLGIAYVQRLGGHINVDLIIRKVPKRAQIFLDITARLIGLAVFAVMAWSSGGVAWKTLVSGEYASGLIHFPLWPSRMALPIGTGLLCIQLVIDLVKLFAGNRVSPAAQKQEWE